MAAEDVQKPTFVSARLIAGGLYHDIDYARLQLLQRLAAYPRVRTKVAPDYATPGFLDGADCLVTYTCDVVPDVPQVDALQAFLDRGGRWLALHGTNSILAQNETGRWFAPQDDTGFMALLGSQFAAHPPIAPYRVHAVNPYDPLVAGVGDFEVEGGDELYYMRLFGDIDILMDAQGQGPARGFVEREWDAETRWPVLYRKRVGAGEIVYFTPGHRRSHYDMTPLVDYYPHQENGAWAVPAFNTILDRCLAWAVGGDVPAQ